MSDFSIQSDIFHHRICPIMQSTFMKLPVILLTGNGYFCLNLEFTSQIQKLYYQQSFAIYTDLVYNMQRNRCNRYH